MSAVDLIRLRVREAGGAAHLALATRAPALAHRGLWRRPPDGPITLYAVYRLANESTMRTLCESLPAGSAVNLHALDEASPTLASRTRSTGPGARMRLLQELLDRWPPVGDVLISDDDVTLTRLADFVALSREAGLDFAMPAHGPDSHYTFRVTSRRPMSTVRLTAFVEIGPVLYLSRRALAVVLPFPAAAQMGWGLDIAWAVLSQMRRGVVDATPMQHLAPVGESYATAVEREASQHLADESGVDSAYDLAHDLGQVWRPWMPRPPW